MVVSEHQTAGGNRTGGETNDRKPVMEAILSGRALNRIVAFRPFVTDNWTRKTILVEYFADLLE
jgi:hypothetical protein